MVYLQVHKEVPEPEPSFELEEAVNNKEISILGIILTVKDRKNSEFVVLEK